MSEIIAEIANVHEGDSEYLINLCNTLQSCPVSYVKFQFILAHEFGILGSAAYTTFNRLEISKSTYCDILDKLSNKRVLFDIFGHKSLQEVIALKKQCANIIGIKLHTTNSLDRVIIKECLNYFDSIFLSLSGVTAIEFAELVSFLRHHDYMNRIIFCYGIQNYPTQPKDTKLNKLAEIKRLCGTRVCLTDHLDGRTELAKTIVSLAAILGYDFIEKHVTLDRNGLSRDNLSSLTVEELSTISANLDSVCNLLVDNVLTLSKPEIDYRRMHKNIIYARTNIKMGETISQNNSISGRQNTITDIYYPTVSEIDNRVSIRNIREGETITYGDCKRNVYAMIIVRAASERFPLKCFKKVGGIEALRFLLKRIKLSKNISTILVCTTECPEDDEIAKIAESEDINVIRGDTNIYRRFEQTFKMRGKPDIFLRLTGDNIFVDPLRIDSVIPSFIQGYFDYYRDSNVFSGCSFEVVRMEAYDSLQLFFPDFHENAEYMTLYLENSFFRIMQPLPGACGIGPMEFRFTLDYPEDLENIRRVYQELNNYFFSYGELCELIQKKKNIYKQFKPIDKKYSIKPIKGCLF